MKTDEHADFEHRVQENQRTVYRIAYSVLRNQEDAQDVTQETFLRAHEKLAALRDPARFRTWVAQIGRRLALNRLRTNARARRREQAATSSVEPQAIDIAGIAEDRVFAERVRSAIDRLPGKLREVVMLSAIEDLDHADIARVLQIPEGTVRSRLHLARKQLLRTLDQ
ncbi:MAG: RNA polymerase sigma factor [Vulcanimicrobiaceae bacterium]